MQRAFIPYRALLLIIVLALTLMPAYAQDDVIRVGAVAPLSSPGSYQQGKELLLGLQWAVDDINAKGGLMGKQVKLFVEDSQGKPPEGGQGS